MPKENLFYFSLQVKRFDVKELKLMSINNRNFDVISVDIDYDDINSDARVNRSGKLS